MLIMCVPLFLRLSTKGDKHIIRIIIDAAIPEIGARPVFDPTPTTRVSLLTARPQQRQRSRPRSAGATGTGPAGDATKRPRNLRD
jgi:hypothetical protein